MPEEQAINTEGVNIPKLIGRIVLYGILVALLLVAGLDFKVKRDYEATVKTWDDKIVELKKEGKSISVEDLEALASGSFKKEVKNEGIVNRTIEYSWNGLIRKYRINVEADTDESDKTSMVESIDAIGSGSGE